MSFLKCTAQLPGAFVLSIFVSCQSFFLRFDIFLNIEFCCFMWLSLKSSVLEVFRISTAACLLLCFTMLHSHMESHPVQVVFLKPTIMNLLYKVPHFLVPSIEINQFLVNFSTSLFRRFLLVVQIKFGFTFSGWKQSHTVDKCKYAMPVKVSFALLVFSELSL